MGRYNVPFLVSLLLFVVLIPAPVQGLCVSSEACGILGGFFLSMFTVPLCLLLFLFAIWPKTRPWLQGFAILPGLMFVFTAFLIVIQAGRIDLAWIPLVHAVLMSVMIGLGRLKPSVLPS